MNTVQEDLKEKLRDELMEFSEKNDVDLPPSWQNRGVEKLQELLNELKGIQHDVKPVGNVAEVGGTPKTETNPFGEKVFDVMIPIDKQNPKKKLMWISVNCKPLYFPIGAIAKMPESYFLVYQNNISADVEVQKKMLALAMKEI